MGYDWQRFSFGAHQELWSSWNIIKDFSGVCIAVFTYTISSLAKPAHASPVHLGLEVG